MTVRNKAKHELELVGPGANVINYLLGPSGFRFLVLILVLTMHPLGRQILGTFGFEFPDQRKLTLAAEKVSVTEAQLNGLVEDVKDLKQNMLALKAGDMILNSKVDNLEHTFHGFQIDFNKWKPETSTQN